jgi:hypothetical protein
MAGLGSLLLTGAAIQRSTAPKSARVGNSRSVLRLRSAESLRAALRFLEGEQSSDGSWRSDHYGAFREGDALTPVVLWAAQNAKNGLEFEACFTRGLRWLERLTDSQHPIGETANDLRYPLFTASYAAQVFSEAGDAKRAAVWASLSEELRISSALGWPEGDPSIGAWSDSPTPPSLSKGTLPPPDMLAPNLSATLLGLRALTAGKRHHEVLCLSLPFLESCQNFAASPKSGLDDGGFFFAPRDSVRNKAGTAGIDASGQARFHSYGSATCDGFLALHVSGGALDDPRMQAAAAWLQQRGNGLDLSGTWMPGRGAARESLTFYYAQAFADTLAILSREERFRDWAISQQERLVEDLISRRRDDGAWQGAAPNSCEDDPVLATAFALHCFILEHNTEEKKRGSGT